MKIGIMQPYWMPYIGYFQLIKSVDIFVIFDDVQYIKGGWINRNKTLICRNNYSMILSIKKDKHDLNINERYFALEIDKQLKKIRERIERTYKKAPFFNDVMDLMKNILNYDTTKDISKFITNSIKEVCEYLNIKTKIIFSSDLIKNNQLKSEEKVIDIVKSLNGDIYINAIGGQKLYSKERFKSEGIELYFLKSNEIKYKQFDNEFIKGLSILDVLMFNSKEKINEYLNDCEFI